MNAPLPPTGTTQAELDALWTQLLTAGQQEMYDWMQRRVPPSLIPHFNHYWEAHSNNPDAATVVNGDRFPVRDANGQTVTEGTAVVTNSMLTRIDVPIAGAIVKHNDMIPIQYSGGQAVQGSPARATVNGLSQLIMASLSVTQAAMVRNNDPVGVRDDTDAPAPGTPGAANVTAQVLNFVKLGPAMLDVSDLPKP